MSDLMREEFEYWVQGRSLCKKRGAKLKKDSAGSYTDYRVNDLWMAWKASRECLVIDTRPIRIEEDFHVEAGVESVFYAAIDAIHAAGVKTK